MSCTAAPILEKSGAQAGEVTVATSTSPGSTSTISATVRTTRAGPSKTPGEAAAPDTARDNRAAVDAYRPDSRSIAVFLLSGGTTGLPKLIARTHDDYLYNAVRSAEVCELGPDTVYFAALPLGHNFPLACPGLLGTLLNGGRVVLGSPNPEKAFPLVERGGVTATALVPAAAPAVAPPVAH